MQKSLLIIVDDWEALEVYENRLSPFFQIRAAAFGSEGIRLAQEERPDWILLDLTLEDMHASEACEKLRARPETKTIPLAVVFNQGEKPYEKPGVFPLPGDQVLQRPYDLDRLVRCMV